MVFSATASCSDGEAVMEVGPTGVSGGAGNAHGISLCVACYWIELGDDGGMQSFQITLFRSVLFVEK